MAKNKTPLKRPKTGLEVEIFILDSDGNPVDEVHKLIKNCRVKDMKYALRTDYQKDIIEIGAFPKVRVENAALSFLNNLEAVIETADKLDLRLYPFGSYPGMYEPERHKKEWYLLQEKMLGPTYKHVVSRVAGVHIHYCLPRGVLNRKTHELRTMSKSNIKQCFLNQFNLAIAADPVLTTLMQSSPFIDGRYIAKDSRSLLYRDMSYKKNGEVIKGLYYRKSLLGGLPSYMETSSDVNYWLKNQNKDWRRLAQNAAIDINSIMRRKSQLDIARGPLKINKLGTLELRGMDMCTPKHIFGTAILIKSAFRRIEEEGLRVKPADRGVHTPFKVEGSTVFVPPFSTVKHELQKESAIKGLESPDILNYCTRFVRFALQNAPERKAPALKFLRRMLQKKQTTSDKIIRKVKRTGYGLNDTLPNQVCAEIAISLSEKFQRDIKETKSNIEYLKE